MGILNSVSNKTRLYWAGLAIVAISSIVFFGTIWYSVYPLYDYSGYYNSDESAQERIVHNLSNAIPFLVGSIVFIIFGTHMGLSGRK